jgi:uncharacterized protein (TIGR04255 family)
MGTKMSNAPVFYALAQVRFNTIALLDQYVPKIQDTFRKAGYPDFQKMVVASISVSAGAGDNQIPAFQQQVRYQFLNEGKTAGFVVDPAGITFQTTDYDTFAPFSAALFVGVRIMHSTLELSYSERIGMRMLDAVTPREGEKLSKYLTPSVLGLTEELGEETLIHSISETRTQRGKAILVSRAIIQKQTEKGVSFAQELHPVPIEVAPKFKEVTGIYGIIDTDCWVEERTKFQPDSLEKTLGSLHDEINVSFAHMVTPHALDVWK